MQDTLFDLAILGPNITTLHQCHTGGPSELTVGRWLMMLCKWSYSQNVGAGCCDCALEHSTQVFQTLATNKILGIITTVVIVIIIVYPTKAKTASRTRAG
jgi:hypothetical protein